jgi:DNA-binding GntR family transcriptional regulator
MLAETASHKQLRNLVAEKLRRAILEGHYKPGEWLRQERLAQELGVSQMPVREALKELTTEGLIEHLPYRGVRVVTFSQEDVSDLYTHRAFLEGRAAEAAAIHITASEIDELKDIHRQMESHSAPEEVGKYRELNRRFHQTIYIASRREYLIRTLTQMWETFPTMLIGNFAKTATAPLPNRETADMREHREIIVALESGDSERAGALVKAHIENIALELNNTIQK